MVDSVLVVHCTCSRYIGLGLSQQRDIEGVASIGCFEKDSGRMVVWGHDFLDSSRCRSVVHLYSPRTERNIRTASMANSLRAVFDWCASEHHRSLASMAHIHCGLTR